MIGDLAIWALLGHYQASAQHSKSRMGELEEVQNRLGDVKRPERWPQLQAARMRR